MRLRHGEKWPFHRRAWKQKFRGVSRGNDWEYRGNDVEALVDLPGRIGCRPIVKVKLGRSAVNCWMRARFRGWVGVMLHIKRDVIDAGESWLFGCVVQCKIRCPDEWCWFYDLKKEKKKRTNSLLSFSVAAEKKEGERRAMKRRTCAANILKAKILAWKYLKFASEGRGRGGR